MAEDEAREVEGKPDHIGSYKAMGRIWIGLSKMGSHWGDLRQRRTRYDNVLK